MFRVNIKAILAATVAALREYEVHSPYVYPLYPLKDTMMYGDQGSSEDGGGARL